jgi:hypothetical protein
MLVDAFVYGFMGFTLDDSKVSGDLENVGALG